MHSYPNEVKNNNHETDNLRIPREHPLRNIRDIADVVLNKQFPQLQEEPGAALAIRPDRLVKAILLQPIYSIRTDHMLCERIRYNVLFQWFLDLPRNDVCWDPVVLGNERKELHETLSRFFQNQKIRELLNDLKHHNIFKPDLSIIRMYLEPGSDKPDHPDKQQKGGKKLRALDDWIWGGRH